MQRVSILAVVAVIEVVSVSGVAISCGGPAAPPPQQQVDVVGIRSELLAIGQAERQYLVSHSAYGTIEELVQDKLLTSGANRRGYVFAVQVDGSQGFTVTATPADEDKQSWPHLETKQTMQGA